MIINKIVFKNPIYRLKYVKVNYLILAIYKIKIFKFKDFCIENSIYFWFFGK